MSTNTTTPIGSQIIPGDFFSFDMDINHANLPFEPEDWPADAPPYHSVAGWALQKEAEYSKLRHEMVNRNCANWFLYRFDMIGDKRYKIVADRLMEIERGE